MRFKGKKHWKKEVIKRFPKVEFTEQNTNNTLAHDDDYCVGVYSKGSKLGCCDGIPGHYADKTEVKD